MPSYVIGYVPSGTARRPVGRSVGRLIGLIGVIRKFVIKIKKNHGFIGIYINIYKYTHTFLYIYIYIYVFLIIIFF